MNGNVSVQISLIRKQECYTKESSIRMIRARKVFMLPPSRGSSFHQGFDSAVEKFDILNALHLDSILYIGVAANRVLEAWK